MAKALGPSLQYFEIGNEVDLFGRHLRDPKTWFRENLLVGVARSCSGRDFPRIRGKVGDAGCWGCQMLHRMWRG